MNPSLRRCLFAAVLALPLSLAAQTPPPAAPRAHPGAMHAPDGYQARLEQMLRDSRSKRSRVVLRVHGEEVAGVVLDVGPGWVVLSNQEGQEILLQTFMVERAEIR
jgi:hypothetical protein